MEKLDHIQYMVPWVHNRFCVVTQRQRHRATSSNRTRLLAACRRCGLKSINVRWEKITDIILYRSDMINLVNEEENNVRKKNCWMVKVSTTRRSTHTNFVNKGLQCLVPSRKFHRNIFFQKFSKILSFEVGTL